MANSPPKVSPAEQAKLDAAKKNKSTSNQSLEVDPFNLNSSGTGILSDIPLDGTYEFFGVSPYAGNAGYNFFEGQGYPIRGKALPPLTAEQTMMQFTHMTGVQLANIQNQMYRAGLYSATYQPVLGQLHPEDISAFRGLIIGLASNPSQAKLGDYLTQAAAAGNATPKSRAPLVVKLKNEDDLRGVLQAGAQQLFGKYLDEGDVNKFIASYHAQEVAAQTASYAATGYNPDTGQQDISGLPGQAAQITGPPTTEGGINQQVTQQMFADKPTEAGEAVFSSHLNQILSALSGRGQ